MKLEEGVRATWGRQDLKCTGGAKKWLVLNPGKGFLKEGRAPPE